jgi:hypothetical protein
MTNYPYLSIAKFAEFVQLKDYRAPTKKEYVRYLLRFADRLERDPATASEDDLRRYFLFLREHKKFGGSAMKLALCPAFGIDPQPRSIVAVCALEKNRPPPASGRATT